MLSPCLVHFPVSYDKIKITLINFYFTRSGET